MAYKKPESKFKKAPQGLDEAKSNGQINLSKKTNITYTARTLFENANILPQIVENIKKEVEQGNNKNAIDFFKAIKEPDDQTINLNGGLEVQKVFIDEETKKKVDKHIDDFIDGKWYWYTVFRVPLN